MPRKRAKFLETRIFGFVIALAVALVVAGLNYGTALLESLDLKTLDTHFFLKMSTMGKTVQEGAVVAEKSIKLSDDILIVGVDFSSLSKFGKWPFPRYRHAELLNAFTRISDPNQRENAILVDVFFNDKGSVPEDDAALLKAITDSGRTFLETMLVFSDESNEERAKEIADREGLLHSKYGTLKHVTGPWKSMRGYLGSDPPLPEFAEAIAGYGHANFTPDRDQVYRYQPLVAKSSILLEELDLADIKPGYKVDEAGFERLAWMDMDGNFHNIDTPLTSKSLAALVKTVEKNAPPKVDDNGANGAAPTQHFIIRRFKDSFVPSITLSLALHYFGKTFDDADVILGKRIRIPAPTRFDPETGERRPYELQMVADKFDAEGNLVKEGKKRGVPYIDIPINANGEMLINFMGYPSSESSDGPQTFTVRPFASLAAKAPVSEDPGTWRRTLAMANKIVMVGAFSKGMADDEKPTPFGLMYGIEVHANALNTIIMDNFIRPAPLWLDLLVLAFMVGLVAFMSSRIPTVFSFFGTLVLLAGYFVGLTTIFETKAFLINFATPAISMIFTFISIVVYRAMTEERDKKKMRETFGKYVSPLLVDQLADNPPELGGIDKELTVFFSDIRGFTSISENMTPQELINHLNEYLTAMTDILLDYGGTLDKYMGDAIMGFWGAPLPQPDHALLACKCALKQMERLHELNKTWPEPKRLDIGIGLNTGKMTVGNMGSPLRLSYTLAGDNVNLGSRLEGTNKAYGTNIIISEYTYGLVRDKVIARELDNIRVKGKNKPVLIYELIDVVDGLDAPRLSQDKGKK